MEDDQTGSLWSQITGECILGEMLGKKLELYPAQFSTFGAQKSNPQVQYLVKPEKGSAESVYKNYFEDRGKMGIFGTIYNDTLLDGKDLVYGIRTDNHQIAVPKMVFAEPIAHLVSIDSLQLLLISGKDTDVSCYVLPTSEKKDYKLKEGDNIVTVSIGENGARQMKFENGIQIEGEALEKFPVITVFWFAWKAFFPTSEIFEL